MKYSVIIPTYNRAELLKESIDSVLNQSYKDFELIIIDDGSIDNTEEILRSYGSEIKYKIIKNSGAEKARNLGAEIASGVYLLFLDNDDLYFPYTIEVYNIIIEQYNDPPLVLGQPLHFKDALEKTFSIEEIKNIEYAVYKDYFSKDRPVYSSSSMLAVRRDVFYSVGQFRHYYEKKEFFLDDIDFMLRAGTICPVIIIYKPLQFGYRWHSENSVKNLKRVLKSLSYLIEEEKEGKFAGGKKRRRERYSIIGGPMYFWIFMALRNGIIKESIGLLIKAWPMIAAGLIKKIVYLVKPKKRLNTIYLTK